jgi:hypothetical protein
MHPMALRFGWRVKSKWEVEGRGLVDMDLRKLVLKKAEPTNCFWGWYKAKLDGQI